MNKDSLIKTYTAYQFFIFPAVIVLSSLFLILFVIYPQVNKFINNQKVSAELLNKSKFLDTKVQALESYNEEDLSKKLGFVLRTYPTEKDFAGTLGLLQQLTAKSGFNISSIAVSNSSGKVGNADSYDVKLEVSGSKALFPILLNNLENSSRLIRVSSIDVSTNQASKTVNVSLVVQVLYSVLPQNFGSEDTPLPQISEKGEAILATLATTNEMPIQNIAVATNSATPSSTLKGKLDPFE